ncbi:hypothetical protein Hanom_Chr06g00561081 [Helianthus anomalus]
MNFEALIFLQMSLRSSILSEDLINLRDPQSNLTNLVVSCCNFILCFCPL